MGAGLVQANANIPEQHTPRATKEHAALAVGAGVDIINLYGPAVSHGYRPTDLEYLAFYDDVLSEIKRPVALAPNPVIGYTPRAALVVEVAHKHPQVVAINLSGLGDSYYIQLKERLERPVDIYVPTGACLETLAMGAAGVLSANANIIPKTHRKMLDAYGRKDLTTFAECYEQVERFDRFVKKWHSAGPRWQKAVMKLLRLPGGEGGVRPPYLMLEGDELAGLASGLLALGIPELDELAQAAGLQQTPRQGLHPVRG